MGHSARRRAATVIVTVCTLVLGSKTCLARSVEEIHFYDAIAVGETRLPLRNAALLRYLKFIRAYVAALYLPEGLPSSDTLADVPKRLELSYLVSIKGSDFGKGAAPVLERNLGPEQLAGLRARIDRINAAYRDVRPGDRYSLTYHPGRGTELALNGTPLVTIEGADFAAAYFGIWLGRKPIDEKLKRDLLAGG